MKKQSEPLRIVEGELPPQMWPLDGPVGNMFVGGKTLRQCQEELIPRGRGCLVANAWVAAGDWGLLMATEGVAKLESHQGEVLAWKDSEEMPHDALVALASEDSFLIRYPWDLLRVNEQVLARIVPFVQDDRAALGKEGRLMVGKGSEVLPGVFVEGTVVVGKDCKIGPNCYLRGSTTIGDGCHIGQAVEIKNSIIGSGTSVGHLSYVGDSVLGWKVNFGAGTITSNLRHDGKNHRSMVDGELIETGRRKFGTIVGDSVHTGIQTAIYPGRKLGPGTTTRPGDVVERDVR